jgi:hypothetical protein
MNKLYEAGTGSNVDKVDSQLNKAISAIQKAQSAVLDAADAMDAVMVDAISCGGRVAELIPPHIKQHIAKLTDIADQQLGAISDGDSQSSLNKLKDVIGNIPYRDLRQPSAEDRRSGIAMQPNLTAGPQSQISENSLESFYRNSLKEEVNNYEYNDNSLNFNKIRESNFLGQKLDGDMMAGINKKLVEKAPPQERQRVTERLRAAADDVMFEDVDMDQLQEGTLDFSRMKAFGGNDGMPLRFNDLSEGGHCVN